MLGVWDTCLGRLSGFKLSGALLFETLPPIINDLPALTSDSLIR